MSAATDRYVLVGRVASVSTSSVYPIKWDTLKGRFTCPCPKWKFGKGTKHCHHVDAVEDHLRQGRLTVQEAILLMASATGTGEYLPQRPVDPIEALWTDINTGGTRRRPGVTMTYAQFRDRVLALGASVTPAPTTRPDWLGGIRAIILRD